MPKTRRVLSDCIVFKSDIHLDDRGYLFERFKKKQIENETGLKISILQENVSYSQKNVIRGIHYQIGPPQHKIVSVDSGCIFDVVVDLRIHSSTFGEWAGVYLNGEDHKQFWIPSGFGHGFQVISENARVNYKMTQVWDPELECGINPLDKTLDINWPFAESAIMSKKDRNSINYENAKYFEK